MVTGNTNATSIMIGERAADFCLGKPPLAPANEPLLDQSKMENEPAVALHGRSQRFVKDAAERPRIALLVIHR